MSFQSDHVHQWHEPCGLLSKFYSPCAMLSLTCFGWVAKRSLETCQSGGGETARGGSGRVRTRFKLHMGLHLWLDHLRYDHCIPQAETDAVLDLIG